MRWPGVRFLASRFDAAQHFLTVCILTKIAFAKIKEHFLDLVGDLLDPSPHYRSKQINGPTGQIKQFVC